MRHLERLIAPDPYEEGVIFFGKFVALCDISHASEDA